MFETGAVRLVETAIFYTPPHNSGGVLWFHVGRPFVCVDVLRPSQPNGVMSSAVSLSNHTFTGQA